MVTKIPTWIAPYIEGKRHFTDKYAGANGVHEYLVVKGAADRSGLLPKEFILFLDGTEPFAFDEETPLLAVSVAYPEAYREIGLMHEIAVSQSPVGRINGRPIILGREIHFARISRNINFKEYLEFRECWFREMSAARLQMAQRAASDEPRIWNEAEAQALEACRRKLSEELLRMKDGLRALAGAH